MRPSKEEIDDSQELVASCYRAADEVLISRAIDPASNDNVTLPVPLLRVMLAGALARGYGEGAEEMLGGIKPHLDALRPQGPAIEHGQKVRVVTASGKKLNPPGQGFLGWLRKVLF